MSRVLFYLAVFLVFWANPYNSYAAEQAQSYSDKDIDRYRNPSDNKPSERKIGTPAAKKVAQKRSHEKQEQDYWCRKASAARKKIEIAKRDVKDKEQDISKEESKSVRTSRKMTVLQGRLKKSKDRLTSAEGDLGDIESDAHRKGIPPGWLRCQFD